MGPGRAKYLIAVIDEPRISAVEMSVMCHFETLAHLGLQREAPAGEWQLSPRSGRRARTIFDGDFAHEQTFAPVYSSVRVAGFDAVADVGDQSLQAQRQLLAADGVFDATSKAGHLVGIGAAAIKQHRVILVRHQTGDDL